MVLGNHGGQRDGAVIKPEITNEAVHHKKKHSLDIDTFNHVAVGSTSGEAIINHHAPVKARSRTEQCLSGPLLFTLNRINDIGYYGKRVWDKVKDARWCARIQYFREALDVECVEDLIIDHVYMDSCIIDQLLQILPIEGSSAVHLREELERFTCTFPEELRKIQVFQSCIRVLMMDPFNAFSHMYLKRLYPNDDDVDEGIEMSFDSVTPVPMTNTLLDDMIETQRINLALMKSKMEKLDFAALTIDEAIRSSLNVEHAMTLNDISMQAWFVEQASKVTKQEISLAEAVLADLQLLQLLHSKIAQWVLMYRAWKSGKKRTQQPMVEVVPSSNENDYNTPRDADVNIELMYEELDNIVRRSRTGSFVDAGTSS